MKQPYSAKFRDLITAFVILAAIICPITTIHASYVCGDIDGNSQGPDISDLTFLVSYMFRGGDAPPNIEAANLDGIASVDIADLTYMIAYLFLGGSVPNCQPLSGYSYTIVSTSHDVCYDSLVAITCPLPGEPFYGQDAQYPGTAPEYLDNGDGTISDLNTGLMWQQSPDLENKSTFVDAVAAADTFSLAGYTDWRLASIKELYSLIDFRGSSFYLIPYIDTSLFDFRFGDESQGERVIDAQYWSSTEYVGTTMNGDATVFGVNFADGRIKGYPRDTGPGGEPFTEFVRYVRGGSIYGVNNFTDNGDGTITDSATGLMWQLADDGVTRNWEAALAYAEGQTLAGHSDWRLPDAKELQSIVDYTRAPDATDPLMQAPAIDPIFSLTNLGTVLDPEYGFYWTGTTHLDAPGSDHAVYLCFGLATGWMEQPPLSGNYVLINVHGAGSQRSDPKTGDPADYPYGNGPQGDVISIFNYTLSVRNIQ